jgi:hypothetical protein
MVLALTTPGGQTGQLVDIRTVCGPDVRAVVADVGGGGGAGQALSTALFVDPATTTPLADQNGAATSPFATLTQGIAALTAPAGGTLLCCPGFYPVETVDLDGRSLTLVGLAGPANLGARVGALVNLSNINISSALAPLNLVNVMIGNVDLQVTPETAQPLAATGSAFVASCNCGSANLIDCSASSINSTGDVQLAACTVVGTVVCAGDSFWLDSTITGDVNCENLTCNNCVLGGIITPVSNFDPTVLVDCTLTGAINSPALVTLQGSTVQAVTCAGLVARDSTVNGVVVSSSELNASATLFADDVSCTQIVRANACAFQGSTLAASAAATHRVQGSTYNVLSGIAGATFLLDAYSANNNPPTGGALWAILAPRAQVTVNVPVLAANAIGSATASASGTGLDGIEVNDQVCANPPTAGVAGGGFLAQCRVSASNTLAFTFHGPTTGGNDSFFVTEI